LLFSETAMLRSISLAFRNAWRADLISNDANLIAETFEALEFFSLMAVLWIVAGDEASPTNATAFPGSDDSLSRPRGGAMSYLRQN
jgi:hypothetical protein